MSKCFSLLVLVSEGDIVLILRLASHNHTKMVKWRMWMVPGSEPQARLSPLLDLILYLANLRDHSPCTRINCKVYAKS